MAWKLWLLVMVATVDVSLCAQCPPGWAARGDYCYFVSDTIYNFDTARSFCQKRQADLVYFESSEERVFVEGLVIQTNRHTWIGMKKVGDKFTWIDGTKPDPEDGEDLVNWDPNRPSGAGLCVGYGGWGKMVDDDCGWTKGYICKRSNTILDICNYEDGWHDMDGMCFKYFDEDRSWFDAKKQCEEQTATLAILDTQDKLDIFNEIVGCKDYSKGVWIGLSDTDSTVEQELKWVDGKILGSVTNWDPSTSQPNFPPGSVNDNCVNAFTASQFKWRIDTCNTQNKYACEKATGTCAEGWQDKGTGFCYLPKYGNSGAEKRTWTDAAKYCEDRGAQLVKITNDDQNNAVKEILEGIKQSNNVNYFRIGTSDRVTDNVYKWQDGSPITYEKFDPEQKEEYPNRMDCGYIMYREDGSHPWGQTYCFDDKNFICQVPIHTAPKDPPEEPPVEWECPPENNWHLAGEECYRYSDSQGTYLQAESRCADLGAMVTSIRDVDEMSVVADLIRGQGNVFVSLRYQDGEHKWHDGSPVTFKNWNLNEPKDPQTRSCTVMRGWQSIDHMWTSEYCDNEQEGLRYHVCRRAATHVDGTPATPEPTVPGTKYCGPGKWHYNPYNNMCYELRFQELKWQEAESACADNDAHLVSIHNFHEQNFLNAMIQATLDAPPNYWIGLNDLDLEKSWLWTDGTPSEYFYWATGEPNNANGEEFCNEMAIWNLGAWNDIKCDYEFSYICQKPAELMEISTEKPPVTEAPVQCTTGKPYVSGMKYVQDVHIYSPASETNRDAFNARINWEGNGADRGGSWTFDESAAEDRNYIQVRLHLGPVVVTGIQTQGAADREEWVTKYDVLYRPTAEGAWLWYGDSEGNRITFDGNTNREEVKENLLLEPTLMMYVRIYPREWKTKPSLRFDVLACDFAPTQCNGQNQLDGGGYWIPDSQFTASDFEEGFEPWKARQSSQSAWKPLASAQGSWLQVELNTVTGLGNIHVQGLKNGDEWVRSFNVMISLNGETWETYQNPWGTNRLFTQNPSDGNQNVIHSTGPKLDFRFLRFVVTEWEKNIAMRVEIKGCKPTCIPVELIDGSGHKLDDYSLSASSSLDGNSGPDRSRMNTVVTDELAGCWIPMANDQNQYIQADFGVRVTVHALATKGEQGGARDLYVTSFNFYYSRDGTDFTPYQENGQTKVFEGNQDWNNIRRQFMTPHSAVAVQIRPLTWNDNGIGLRWEIYGCAGAVHEIGCYADTENDRDLPNEAIVNPPGGMTHDICTTHCQMKNYLYAGAQYGYECFCGNDYGRFGPSSNCNMKCTGDHSATDRTNCGGHSANTIFSTGLSMYAPRCRAGWLEYAGRCFKFNSQKLSWHDAEAMCMKDNGHLATVRTEAEQNFIRAQTSIANMNMWIGFHCLANKFLFEWTSGLSVTYTDWARREPNGARDNEDCVYAYNGNNGNTGWNDNPCGQADGYVCEHNKENMPGVTDAPTDGKCPQGWVEYRWKCFSFNEAMMTWEQHSTACQSLGGNLARIEDSSEQSYIQSYLANTDRTYWTDLTSRQQAQLYLYSNGEAPTYSNWGQDQPSASETACVMFNEEEHGFWFDEGCDTGSGAICEMLKEGETHPTDAPTQPPSGSCAAGWLSYGDYCYLASEETSGFRRSFTDAYEACSAMGADLASVHSAEENDYLFRMGVAAKNERFWLGMNRVGTGGSFQWTDQTTVGYTNWDNDQPSDEQLDNCVVMSQTTGAWSAVLCDSSYNWICKIRRGNNPTVTTTQAPPTAGPPGSCSPDDDTWKSYGGRCFKFVGPSDARSWYAAEAYCNTNGGYLASIHDETTNLFVMGQVRSIDASNLWIGLNELGSGGWTWTDGEPTDYTLWADGAPGNSAGTALCVQFQNMAGIYGTWKNNHCEGSNAFICTKMPGGVTVTTTTAAPREGNCPSEYKSFRDKCFKMFNEEVSWEEANSRCKQENNPQSLATISSFEEQGFITSKLLDNQREYWIGLHQFQTGVFGWADNAPVTYTNWARNEPNGGEEEQCVHIYYDRQHAGQWNDAPSQQTKAYICMAYKSTSNPIQPTPINPCEYPEEGYQPFNDDCYKFASESSRTWDNGEAHCREDEGMPGHITSVLSPYEQGFIVSELYDFKEIVNPGSKVWLGLSDKDQPGRYQWSDENTVIYSNWQENQPDYPKGGCVYLDFADGRWVDTDCGVLHWTLCKRSNKAPVYTRPPADGSCPISSRGEDWIEFGDYCYLFMEQYVTLSAARLECNVRSQAELASVHSDEESAFIGEHIKSPTFNGWWWIGLIRAPGSAWMWTDGREVGYVAWSPGEPSDPDGSGGENCVEIYTSNGKWNDVSCDVNNGFVCMVRRGGYTAPTTRPPSAGTQGSTTTGSPYPTNPTGTPPGQGSTTPNPSIGGPGDGGSGAMSAGAVVGLIFFLMFVLLAVLLVAVFVMRRRAQEPAFLQNLIGGGGAAVPEDGFENPSYESTRAAAENVLGEEGESGSVGQNVEDIFGTGQGEDSMA